MGINKESLQSDLNTVGDFENAIVDVSTERLNPLEIQKKQAYISAERQKYGQKKSPDEPTFQAWETMIENYNAALQKSRNAQTEVVPDDKKSTSPFVMSSNSEKVLPVSKEVRSEMAELKQEAGQEMQDILKDGSPQAIQRALEFTESLATLDVTENWLDVKEKELLKPYIPTLKGISGAILVDALTRNGYTMNFQSNGELKITNKSKDSSAADMALKIDTMVNRPGAKLGEIIKAGMLYSGGNLTRYMEGIQDSSGNIIDPAKMSAPAYAEYLKQLGNNATPFEKMIAQNPAIINKLDFPGYAQGTQYIGSVVAETQKYMSDPKNIKATQNAANAATNGNSVNSAGSGGKNNELLANFADHPAKRALQEIALIGKKGYGEIFSSPETTIVAILGFIAVWFTTDFKTAIATLMGGVALAGGYDRVTGDHVPTASEGGSGTNKEHENASPAATIDKSFDTQFNTALEIVFLKEDISKEREVLDKVKDTNYETLRKSVIDGVQASGPLATVMADPFSKKTLETYVKYLEQKDDAISTRIKIMRESTDVDVKKAYAGMSLKDMNEKIFDLDSGFKSAIAEISAAIERTTDPEEKEVLQKMLAHMQNAQASGDPQVKQKARGYWDMICNNKGKIGGLAVGAFILYKIGAFKLVSVPLSLTWATVLYGFKFMGNPKKTIKSMPADIKAYWAKAGEVPPPPTLGEKVKGMYRGATDKLQGGLGRVDFEHMDGLKNELTTKGIDTTFLDEFKTRVTDIQKLHPGTAKYLKGENELRAFLNTMPKATQDAVLAYAKAGKFMIPEQGYFVTGLLKAMTDAKNAPIVSNGARFIISLFKKI